MFARTFARSSLAQLGRTDRWLPRAKEAEWAATVRFLSQAITRLLTLTTRPLRLRRRLPALAGSRLPSSEGYAWSSGCFPQWKDEWPSARDFMKAHNIAQSDIDSGSRSHCTQGRAFRRACTLIARITADAEIDVLGEIIGTSYPIA
jgi:hypothetical protein